MIKPNFHYNRYLKENAQNLRNHSTRAEIRLWSLALRNRKTGYRCLRQRPIDKFIADFFFPEVKLVLEVDGYSHSFEEKIMSDVERDKRLLSLGYSTLRVQDQAVFEDIDNVIRRIEYELELRRLELGVEVPVRKSRRKRE